MLRLFPTTRLPIAAVLATLLACDGACGETQHQRLEAGGVRIARVERGADARSAGGVAAVAGDYVLEDGTLRVLVGGLRRGGEARGAVLEAILDGAPAEDSLVLLAPRVQVGADTHAVVPREMYVVDRGGRPALRVLGDALVDERTVLVEREITLARAGQGLSIHTRVQMDDGEPVEGVRAGARIAWGGAQPWVPGVGPLDDQVWHDASWIGRNGEQLGTAFAYAPGPSHLRAVFERHGASRFLSHTAVASPRVDLDEDGVLAVKSVLTLARPGLAEAVRRLGWVRGEPFPEALVSLPYAPRGSTITVETGDGEPLIETPPDDRGQALVPLSPIRPAGTSRSWIARATAFGHAPSGAVMISAPEQRVRLEIPRGGRIRVTAVDAATGDRVAVRVRIQGLGGTPSPRLGPTEADDGATGTVVTSSGDITIPVEPGTYRVVVTRGPEHSIEVQRVEVTETFQPQVDAEIRHVVDPGDWIGCDFHVHAAPSPDSQVSLADRVASLAAEGVRFAVPTDHNHVTDYGAGADELGIEGFGTIPGVEVTTWEPSYGHFNAYPWTLDPDAPANGAPEYRRTRPSDLFAALHAAGDDVIVQVNHPRMEHDIGYFEVMGLNSRTGSAADGYSGDFDALEVWNGFDLARLEMFDRVFEDWLNLLTRGQRVVATGNSDSHRVRYQWAGYPRTYVQVPGFDPDDPRAVVRALGAGRAFVTSGPFLEVWVGDAVPGDSVPRPASDLPVGVRVRAPAWMDVSRIEVYAGRTLVHTEPVAASPEGAEPPVVRFDGEIAVPVRRAGFLIVVARGDRPLERLMGRGGIPPLAFTNPIWIEDPARTPRPGRRAPADAGGGAADSGTPVSPAP